ncbi:hypothetical protein [Nocardia sp. BMG51109]|uniref:hypothetical protein n=1 Tax=Nocardia sp. BMG51109 TaxID=1056816 RepID=UPI0004BB518E|nr:hypothetical protein [Nocardia sp. BMG51109]
MARTQTLVAVLGATLIGAATVATAPSATADPYPQCDFAFHQGQPYLQEPVSVIVGGYVACNTPPERFHAALTLSYRRDGRWIVQGAQQSDAVPNLRLNIATYARCEDGAWIGAADMWETREGRVLAHSIRTPPTFIQC